MVKGHSCRGRLFYPLSSPIQNQVSWLKILICTCLVAQTVENLPAVWETKVQSLGWEDPLEEEMATNSSILAWRTPRTEEPGGLQAMESQSQT